MNVFYSEIILLIISFTDGQKFDILNEHTQCPSTEGEWKKQSDARSCTDQTSYHCLINQYGEFGEVCLNPKPIVVGQCPMYNTATKRIGYTPCMSKEGCAGHTYHSNESYKYKACMRYPTVSSSTENRPTTTIFTTTTTNGSSSSPVVAIAIVLPLILIIGIGITVWWFYLRKNYNYQIHNPFTGGAIRICHQDEKEPGDLEEQISLVGSDKNTGEIQSETPLKKKIKRSNPNFVETKNYREIITMLEKNNVVLVVGNTGIGKSTTCVRVLEHYRQKLEWKTIHFPFDAVDKVDERTIVLVDVTFGDLSLYSRYDSNIENMMNRLYTSTRECKEFKVLITSSSSLTNSQTNFSILKGCSELNMSYDTSDLRDLYKEYTEPKCNTVNEGEDKSKEKSKSNQVVNLDRAKDASTHEDYETTSALEIGNGKMENTINVGQKLSDTVISTKSDDGPQLSINPQQSEESAMRNERNELVDHNQTSTEDTCSGNEENRKSSSDPEISCPPTQESGEDRENDPFKVEIEITYNHEEGNLEEDGKLKQETEETWKKSNVSKFGLPIVCYLPGGIEWNASSSESLDIISIFEIYLKILAESDNGFDRQKYKTLVYIMLNGSTIDSEFLHKKLLSEIDPDLTQDRLRACSYELAEIGVLDKKGNLYSFHNDLLLLAVVHSFASRDIRTFTSYCYLPFIMQFLRPKSIHLSNHFVVEVDVDWETLCKFGSGLVKRQKRNENEFQNFELYQIFREKLQFHEERTMEYYKIDKTTMDGSGSAFVRKMANHYPELKEYYSYAEPDKFRSIPESGFKATVKNHPPCTYNKNDFTKK